MKLVLNCYDIVYIYLLIEMYSCYWLVLMIGNVLFLVMSIEFKILISLKYVL